MESFDHAENIPGLFEEAFNITCDWAAELATRAAHFSAKVKPFHTLAYDLLSALSDQPLNIAIRDRLSKVDFKLANIYRPGTSTPYEYKELPPALQLLFQQLRRVLVESSYFNWFIETRDAFEQVHFSKKLKEVIEDKNALIAEHLTLLNERVVDSEEDDRNDERILEIQEHIFAGDYFTKRDREEHKVQMEMIATRQRTDKKIRDYVKTLMLAHKYDEAQWAHEFFDAVEKQRVALEEVAKEEKEAKDKAEKKRQDALLRYIWDEFERREKERIDRTNETKYGGQANTQMSIVALATPTQANSSVYGGQTDSNIDGMSQMTPTQASSIAYGGQTDFIIDGMSEATPTQTSIDNVTPSMALVPFDTQGSCWADVMNNHATTTDDPYLPAPGINIAPGFDPSTGRIALPADYKPPGWANWVDVVTSDMFNKQIFFLEHSALLASMGQLQMPHWEAHAIYDQLMFEGRAATHTLEMIAKRRHREESVRLSIEKLQMGNGPQVAVPPSAPGYLPGPVPHQYASQFAPQSAAHQDASSQVKYITADAFKQYVMYHITQSSISRYYNSFFLKHYVRREAGTGQPVVDFRQYERDFRHQLRKMALGIINHALALESDHERQATYRKYCEEVSIKKIWKAAAQKLNADEKQKLSSALGRERTQSSYADGGLQVPLPAMDKASAADTANSSAGLNNSMAERRSSAATTLPGGGKDASHHEASSLHSLDKTKPGHDDKLRLLQALQEKAVLRSTSTESPPPPVARFHRADTVPEGERLWLGNIFGWRSIHDPSPPGMTDPEYAHWLQRHQQRGSDVSRRETARRTNQSAMNHMAFGDGREDAMTAHTGAMNHSDHMLGAVAADGYMQGALMRTMDNASKLPLAHQARLLHAHARMPVGNLHHQQQQHRRGPIKQHSGPSIGSHLAHAGFGTSRPKTASRLGQYAHTAEPQIHSEKPVPSIQSAGEKLSTHKDTSTASVAAPQKLSTSVASKSEPPVDTAYSRMAAQRKKQHPKQRQTAKPASTNVETPPKTEVANVLSHAEEKTPADESEPAQTVSDVEGPASSPLFFSPANTESPGAASKTTRRLRKLAAKQKGQDKLAEKIKAQDNPESAAGAERGSSAGLVVSIPSHKSKKTGSRKQPVAKTASSAQKASSAVGAVPVEESSSVSTSHRANSKDSKPKTPRKPRTPKVRLPSSSNSKDINEAVPPTLAADLNLHAKEAAQKNVVGVPSTEKPECETPTKAPVSALRVSSVSLCSSSTLAKSPLSPLAPVFRPSPKLSGPPTIGNTAATPSPKIPPSTQIVGIVSEAKSPLTLQERILVPTTNKLANDRKLKPNAMGFLTTSQMRFPGPTPHSTPVQPPKTQGSIGHQSSPYRTPTKAATVASRVASINSGQVNNSPKQAGFTGNSPAQPLRASGFLGKVNSPYNTPTKPSPLAGRSVSMVASNARTSTMPPILPGPTSLNMPAQQHKTPLSTNKENNPLGTPVNRSISLGEGNAGVAAKSPGLSPKAPVFQPRSQPKSPAHKASPLQQPPRTPVDQKTAGSSAKASTTAFKAPSSKDLREIQNELAMPARTNATQRAIDEIIERAAMKPISEPRQAVVAIKVPRAASFQPKVKIVSFASSVQFVPKPSMQTPKGGKLMPHDNTALSSPPSCGIKPAVQSMPADSAQVKSALSTTDSPSQPPKTPTKQGAASGKVKATIREPTSAQRQAQKQIKEGKDLAKRVPLPSFSSAVPIPLGKLKDGQSLQGFVRGLANSKWAQAPPPSGPKASNPATRKPSFAGKNADAFAKFEGIGSSKWTNAPQNSSKPPDVESKKPLNMSAKITDAPSVSKTGHQGLAGLADFKWAEKPANPQPAQATSIKQTEEPIIALDLGAPEKTFEGIPFSVRKNVIGIFLINVQNVDAARNLFAAKDKAKITKVYPNGRNHVVEFATFADRNAARGRLPKEVCRGNDERLSLSEIWDWAKPAATLQQTRPANAKEREMLAATLTAGIVPGTLEKLDVDALVNAIGFVIMNGPSEEAVRELFTEEHKRKITKLGKLAAKNYFVHFATPEDMDAAYDHLCKSKTTNVLSLPPSPQVTLPKTPIAAAKKLSALNIHKPDPATQAQEANAMWAQTSPGYQNESRYGNARLKGVQLKFPSSSPGSRFSPHGSSPHSPAKEKLEEFLKSPAFRSPTSIANSKVFPKHRLVSGNPTPSKKSKLAHSSPVAPMAFTKPPGFDSWLQERKDAEFKRQKVRSGVARPGDYAAQDDYVSATRRSFNPDIEMPDLPALALAEQSKIVEKSLDVVSPSKLSAPMKKAKTKKKKGVGQQLVGWEHADAQTDNGKVETPAIQAFIDGLDEMRDIESREKASEVASMPATERRWFKCRDAVGEALHGPRQAVTMERVTSDTGSPLRKPNTGALASSTQPTTSGPPKAQPQPPPSNLFLTHNRPLVASMPKSTSAGASTTLSLIKPAPLAVSASVSISNFTTSASGSGLASGWGTFVPFDEAPAQRKAVLRGARMNTLTTAEFMSFADVDPMVAGNPSPNGDLTGHCHGGHAVQKSAVDTNAEAVYRRLQELEALTKGPVMKTAKASQKPKFGMASNTISAQSGEVVGRKDGKGKGKK